MGQRLVVTVISKQETIAKIYYHWSAYSINALEEARYLIEKFYDEEYANILNYRLRLIRILEEHDGGIDGGKDSPEFAYIQKLFPNEEFQNDPSRNNGLIALSEKGMEDLENWSEGDLSIDLDNQIVFSSVYFEYEDIESYNEEVGEEFKILEDEIPKILFDPSTIPFSDLNDAIHELIKIPFAFQFQDTFYILIA